MAIDEEYPRITCNREHKHSDGETSTKLEVHID
jgi:hypothetical protein